MRALPAVLTTALLAASGCSLLPANGANTDPAPPAPAPAPPPSTPPPPAPRPFDLPMQDVQPCDLLTDEQRSQLGFDRDPLPDAEIGFDDAATCSYRNTAAKVGARLSLITTEGMDVWTSDAAQVEAVPITVADFPALVIKTPELDRSCNVEVDVAEGQHLDVLYRDDGGRPPTPLNSLCDGAKRVAESAVASLRHPAPATSSDARTPDAQNSRTTDGHDPSSNPRDPVHYPQSPN